MPFPKQNAKTFTQASIENLTPKQMGVYGLYRQDKWIYIGKGDIRQRLLDHLNGDNYCIVREKPTNWIVEVTTNMDEREKELILEFNPICNQKIGLY
jgi:hypothetical protein